MLIKWQLLSLSLGVPYVSQSQCFRNLNRHPFPKSLAPSEWSYWEKYPWSMELLEKESSICRLYSSQFVGGSIGYGLSWALLWAVLWLLCFLGRYRCSLLVASLPPGPAIHLIVSLLCWRSPASADPSGWPSPVSVEGGASHDRELPSCWHWVTQCPSSVLAIPSRAVGGTWVLPTLVRAEPCQVSHRAHRACFKVSAWNRLFKSEWSFLISVFLYMVQNLEYSFHPSLGLDNFSSSLITCIHPLIFSPQVSPERLPSHSLCRAGPQHPRGQEQSPLPFLCSQCMHPVGCTNALISWVQWAQCWGHRHQAKRQVLRLYLWFSISFPSKYLLLPRLFSTAMRE